MKRQPTDEFLGKFPYSVSLRASFWMHENIKNPVTTWLKANCTGKYTVAINWIAFANKEDAVFFTLSHNV